MNLAIDIQAEVDEINGENRQMGGIDKVGSFFDIGGFEVLTPKIATEASEILG